MSDKLKKSMDDLGGYIKKAQEENKKLSGYNTILTVALVVVIVIFLFVIYSNLKSNFSGENVMAAVNEYSPKIMPEVSSAMVQVVTEVSPTYSKILQEKAVNHMPILAETADAELVKLSENISKNAKDTLTQTMKNVIDGQKKNIQEGIEGIKEEQIDEGLKGLEEELGDAFMEVGTHIIDNSLNEFVSLKKTVDSFQDKSLPDDGMELSILFLHNLILLADEEMMTNLKGINKEGGK